jgi:hypothetical protein
MGTTPLTPAQIQADFRAAWWGSLPTPVQALANQNLSQAQRDALVTQLIASGYGQYMLFAVMEDDWDPFVEFAMAWQDGCVNGLPNILQIGLGEAGQFSEPGEVPGPDSLGAYPTAIHLGWVPTYPMPQLTAIGADVPAILASWFPPHVPPTPPPDAPTDPVGKQITATIFADNPGVDESNWPNGSEHTDSRGTFTHVVFTTPFATTRYWLLTQAPA